MERRESNGEKREEEECAREVRRRKSSRKGKENCAGMRGIITATLSAGILLDFRYDNFFSDFEIKFKSRIKHLLISLIVCLIYIRGISRNLILVKKNR